MAGVTPGSYPRPDFERSQLRWLSLNGPWDFLFDDEDVGLSKGWQLSELPTEVAITSSNSDDAWAGSEAESITQKIAALPEKLVKNNAFTRSKGTSNTKKTIQVPFVFQSPASGINERSSHEVLWYERTIQDLRTSEEKLKGDRLLVRFGAVDYEATIWVDGQYFGSHQGGHVPFDVDVSDAFREGHMTPKRLTLRVFDSSSDLTQPRGKQYWGAKPESIFYTPSSGIWQSVWLEAVPQARIVDGSGGTIIRSDDIENGILHATIAVAGRRAGQQLKADIEVAFQGTTISKSGTVRLTKESSRVSIDAPMHISEEKFSSLPAGFRSTCPRTDSQAWRNGVALWSVEHPSLYDLTIRLYDGAGSQIDEVRTTTGMRSLSWKNGDGTFRLNGRPLFQALCLDQGYWPETFMTPPTPQDLKKDIELSKKMGFNGCRKHQKVEDPIFHYWADRLGYLVWGEIANAYSFSPEYVERFDKEWMEAVRRDINHPCIVTWTPVNESWAYTSLKDNIEQRNHIRSLFYMTKTLDPTRSINDNCGWEHVCNDLTTFHDYADAPELAKTCSDMAGILSPKANRSVFTAPIGSGTVSDTGASHGEGTPVICTEFGGVNIAPAKDDKAGELDWGYTTASDPADLLQRLEKLMQAVVGGGHICGFVYTQLADIEQEVNGLYSFDRKEKLDAAKVKAAMDAAQQVYYRRVGLA